MTIDRTVTQEDFARPGLQAKRLIAPNGVLFAEGVLFSKYAEVADKNFSGESMAYTDARAMTEEERLRVAIFAYSSGLGAIRFKTHPIENNQEIIRCKDDTDII